jgi:hypothetical protein
MYFRIQYGANGKSKYRIDEAECVQYKKLVRASSLCRVNFDNKFEE